MQLDAFFGVDGAEERVEKSSLVVVILDPVVVFEPPIRWLAPLIDIEVVFFYPWAVALHRLRAYGLAEMAVFAGLLLLGYAYVWRKGALKWD